MGGSWSDPRVQDVAGLSARGFSRLLTVGTPAAGRAVSSRNAAYTRSVGAKPTRYSGVVRRIRPETTRCRTSETALDHSPTKWYGLSVGIPHRRH